MALKGNLRDFNLAEIFQLISMGKKTGALVITAGEISSTIYFRGGGIYAAYSGWKAAPFEERLSKFLKTSPDEIKKISQEAGKSGIKLGEYLVAKKSISQEDLKGLLSEHLADSLFDVFTWQEGDFFFEPNKEDTEFDLGITVDVSALMEVTEKRLEEWRKVKEKIPSLDLVFVLSLKPAEAGKDIVLKPIEWKALYYLDGQNDVRALSEQMGLSEFEACRVLYRLVAESLVEPTSKKKAEVITLKQPAPAKEERPEEKAVKAEKVAKEEEKVKPPTKERISTEATDEEIKKKADQVVEEITARITEQILGSIGVGGAETKPEVEVEVEKKEEVPEEELEEMLEELTALTEGEESAEEAVEEATAEESKKPKKEEPKKEESKKITMDENISRELVLQVIKGIRRL